MRPPSSGLAAAILLLAFAAGAFALNVTTNTAAAPDLADWTQQAAALSVEWFPKAVQLLPSEGFTPATDIHIVVKDMDGVAYTSGHQITISSRYVRGHQKDLGMVVHELTHVVQAYQGAIPPGFDRPGWLVEGIAHYIRIVHYEPQAPRPKLNLDKASYRDAYKTTAMFLEWIEKASDKDFVKKVNAALRQNQFKMAMFQQLTGKNVNDLWQAFIASQRSKQ